MGAAEGVATEHEAPPQVVGGFRLERLIARGGTALLYEARRLSDERRVALKLIGADSAGHAARRERLEREARAMTALGHANVVAVHGVGEADGQLFIAMQLIEGSDLQQILDREGPLDPARALAIVGQVASGLDAAHAAGLVHRDVKPGNVMVQAREGGGEHCYLVDFGLATARDASSVTATGTWAGTPAYVSPEQLRGDPLDARTDVYALGVLAFHALAGRAPYAREHDSGTVLAHLHAEPPSLAELRPELPNAVDGVIARALAKTPEERPASAGELARELERALRESGPARRELAGPRSATLSSRGNLPPAASSFLGRRTELRSATEALRDGARLLSIVGPGGVGKTALALRLAANALPEHDGAWAVELDSVRNLAGIELALARALGLRIASPSSLRSDLIELIGSRRLLLLFDNCEHLIAEVGGLTAELLAACPSLTVLATSREPLSIGEESVLLLGALEVPDADDESQDILARDSARLLLERAREHGVRVEIEDGAAASIARICARLDGIPLAIELAAARLRTLTVAELDRRLERDLGVLASAATELPERQRTLDGLIAWSWQLLDPAEQTVLSRLAVFAGSFALDAAETVAAGDGEPADIGPAVLALADKSLLHVDANRAQARFRMLQPVREFCMPRLVNSPEHAAVRAAHRAHFLALAERTPAQLASADAPQWLERLDQDQPDLRSAIESGLRDGDFESAVRTGVALRQFWSRRGLAGEGIEVLERTIAELDGKTETRSRARAHGAAARLAAGMLGDARRAEPHALEALKLARACDDVDTAAEALTCLSWNESFAGRAAEGLARAEEALADADSIADPAVRANLLDAKGLALEQLGDTNAAAVAYAQARDTFASAGDRVGVAVVENHLGNLALGGDDLAAASARFALARATAEEAGDGASVAMAALNLALIECLEGDAKSARDMFLDSLLTNRSSGDRANIAFAIFGLALTEPDTVRAGELHGSAESRLAALEIVLSTREERQRAAELERLRAALGADRLRAAIERGRRLAVEDVIVAVAGEPA